MTQKSPSTALIRNQFNVATTVLKSNFDVLPQLRFHCLALDLRALDKRLSCTNWARVSPTPLQAQMLQPWFRFFNRIRRLNGCHRTAHNRDFCLSEPIDTLFHITDDANGRVPWSQRAKRFICFEPTMAPETRKETEVCWVGVLVFINNEGPILAANRLQGVETALKVFVA